MKRWAVTLILGAFFPMVSGCRNSDERAVYQAEAVVPLKPLHGREEIDWNAVAAQMKDQAMFHQVAAKIGMDGGKLKAATKIEVDFQQGQLRVVAQSHDEGEAQICADGFARALVEARRATDRELRRLRSDVTLEQDRLTYEKAVEALQESEGFGAGVLFQKSEEVGEAKE